MSNFHGTPSNVDLFTRYWMEGFDERDVIERSMVWLPFFTNGKTLFSPDRNVADIEIRKGNMKYAKMRLRGNATQTIGDNIKGIKASRWSSISRTYPLMEDKGYIGADQIGQRTFNENPYADRTRQNAIRKFARDEMDEMVRRMASGFNLLAKSSILEGFQPAIFGTTETALQYDMHRHADMTFTVANAWDTVGGTIFDDLEEAANRVHINGHRKPDAFFTRGSVITAMIENTAFSAIAENRRFNLVGVGASDKSGQNPVTSMPSMYQRFVDAGWTYRGWVQTASGYMLHVLVTPDFVEEDNGTRTDMVNAGYGLVCSTDARADRYFGPEERLPMTQLEAQNMQQLTGINPLMYATGDLGIKNKRDLITPDMFYFYMWKAQDGSNLTIEGQSAPIFVTTHTDVYCTLKGLTT